LAIEIGTVYFSLVLFPAPLISLFVTPWDFVYRDEQLVENEQASNGLEPSPDAMYC
jgi:hypothetical protein